MSAAAPTSSDKIRCYKNVANASIDSENRSYPVRLSATTIDGAPVEVLLTPAIADQLGRRLIDLGTMSLAFWKPPI